MVKEANKMRDFKIQIVGCGYIGRKIAITVMRNFNKIAGTEKNALNV
ncbi:hypothetical protein MNBD_GAMMA10-2894 [hydrothermal vent metagenome]|uniref:Uncharacterized protein n=1 Tax=hydrothermal vent metagenome TaxID=652676 RepID=A0A3B0XKV7_9ZZZZ